MRASGAPGVMLAGVQLSRRTETEHVLLFGLPGGGKTSACIFPWLDQARGRGDRVILHDPKGDYTSSRYDSANCVLLGPWDDRAVVWDGGADFFDAALVDEFAKQICGADPATAGANYSFHEGAALLIGGLIKATMAEGSTWTWVSLVDELNKPAREVIHRSARGDALVEKALSTTFLAPGAEVTKGEQAMISIMGTSARWIVQLAAVQRAKPDARLFSLRRWLLGEGDTDITMVILNNNAQYGNVSKAVLGAMLNVVAALAASSAMPEKPASADGCTWLLLDEALMLGPVGLRAIQQISSLGRSRGMRVVLGLQSPRQLADEVGEAAAAPMLDMQGLRLYFRCGAEPAKAVADLTGEREIVRIANTATAGAVQGKTATHARVPVLETSDLLGLEAIEVKPGVLDIELLAQHFDAIYSLRARVRRADFEPYCPQSVPSIAWARGTLPEPVPARGPAPVHEPDSFGFLPDETPNLED
jgi:hypothetical protein